MSATGGHDPIWSADGKQLYFTTDGPKLMVSRLLSSAPAFETPKVVLDRGFIGWAVSSPQTYQVARDGRLLVLQEEGGPAPASRTMIAILGWFDDSRRKVQH